MLLAITYLRRWKNCCATAIVAGKSANPWGKQLCRHQGGRGCPPSARAEIPLQSAVKTRVRKAVLLQPEEASSGADTPWEACTGADSWQDLWREEATPDQVCWQDLWLLERDPHWGSSCRVHWRPLGRTQIEDVCGGLSPMGGTPYWSTRRVLGVLPLRIMAGTTSCVPLCCWWGRGRESQE